MKAIFKKMIKEANEKLFAEYGGNIKKAQKHSDKLLKLANSFADKAKDKGFNWLQSRNDAHNEAFNHATGQKTFGNAGGNFIKR